MMNEKAINDGDDQFSVSVYESEISSRFLLFAVGAGGNPSRYDSFLSGLASFGYFVVAPHFEMLRSPRPSEEELTLRARRLSLALENYSSGFDLVYGVGHSIGATTLVAMSGAKIWLGPELHVSLKTQRRFSRLVLLAPPTGFFLGPGALDEFSIPIQVWVGSEDHITPPDQSKWLADALSKKQAVDLKIIDGAGHFSFMDKIPPNTVEPLDNKRIFIRECARDISEYLTRTE
tara:strand:+ start:1076 stop:1774 length:699 start_codon:yes stop_codon:yes gene_type:complete